MRDYSRLLAVTLFASFAAASATTARAATIGYYPSSLSENTTGASDSPFTGAPDDQFYGLGGQTVTYDFGTARVINGAGPDFNVYEVDWGNAEFDAVQISVSNDGLTFYDLASTYYPAVDLVGDDTHSDAAFRRSFDLADIPALAADGITSIRYIRFDGAGTGAAGSTSGFDLDAVGAVNFQQVPPTTAVPTPAAATAGTALLGALGLLRSRRRA